MKLSDLTSNEHLMVARELTGGFVTWECTGCRWLYWQSVYLDESLVIESYSEFHATGEKA